MGGSTTVQSTSTHSAVASLSTSIANIDLSPAYWVVTPFAGTSERAGMRIVLAVTTGAIGCDLKARRVLLAVTALAFQSRMRADEGVTGLPSVIEPPMRPGARIVTALAFRSCAKMALVIILVAALAGHRQFERGCILVRVAAFTFQSLMRAGEWITGLARMIELPFVPCERIVAIPA